MSISSRTAAALNMGGTNSTDVHRSVSRAGLGVLSVKMGREGKQRVNCSGNQHPSNPNPSNPDSSG